MTDGISPTRMEWCIAERMHPMGAQFEGEGRSPVDLVLEVMGDGGSLRGCTLVCSDAPLILYPMLRSLLSLALSPSSEGEIAANPYLCAGTW